MNLKVGQRVQTKMGWGTVLGFEIFINNGCNSGISFEEKPEDEVDNRRFILELDNPLRWGLASEAQAHPYMSYSDITKE